MRTLKFKSQLTVYSRVERSRLSVVIGRFRSFLFVSVFQGSLADAIIMIDGSEKPNRQSSHVIANRTKQVYDVLLSSR